MGCFFQAQILFYLFLVCPSAICRWIIFLIWLLTSLRKPLAAGLGALWQLQSLVPGVWHDFDWRANLECEDRFWFICSSREASWFVGILSAGRLGVWSQWLRDITEANCMAWHPFWGKLAFSLLMGGKPDESLKTLYRSLGFLHVLVISGTQFSILSRALKNLCQAPVIALYSSTLIDWRWFRPLILLADVFTLFGLSIYLLACGASPPCQRAYLQYAHLFLQRWFWSSSPSSSTIHPQTKWIFQMQMLLFPTQWFSLSSLLSWGAVHALKFFGPLRNVYTQMRISISIQLLSLALFSRLSLASLLFDFFVSPFWDILLFVCLAGIFVPELHMRMGMTSALDHFHELLWKIDLWQSDFFGSSTLSFRAPFAWWGRFAAAMIFASLFLSYQKRSDRQPQ